MSKIKKEIKQGLIISFRKDLSRDDRKFFDEHFIFREEYRNGDREKFEYLSGQFWYFLEENGYGEDYKENESLKWIEETIQDELLTLSDTSSFITPEKLISYAKNESTFLNHFFEWNDSIAASEYRRLQAANLIITSGFKVKVSINYRPPESTSLKIKVLNSDDMLSKYSIVLNDGKIERKIVDMNSIGNTDVSELKKNHKVNQFDLPKMCKDIIKEIDAMRAYYGHWPAISDLWKFGMVDYHDNEDHKSDFNEYIGMMIDIDITSRFYDTGFNNIERVKTNHPITDRQYNRLKELIYPELNKNKTNDDPKVSNYMRRPLSHTQKEAIKYSISKIGEYIKELEEIDQYTYGILSRALSGAKQTIFSEYKDLREFFNGIYLDGFQDEPIESNEYVLDNKNEFQDELVDSIA